jgi:hypothetical protein
MASHDVEICRSACSLMHHYLDSNDVNRDKFCEKGNLHKLLSDGLVAAKMEVIFQLCIFFDKKGLDGNATYFNEILRILVKTAIDLETSKLLPMVMRVVLRLPDEVFDVVFFKDCPDDDELLPYMRFIQSLDVMQFETTEAGQNDFGRSALFGIGTPAEIKPSTGMCQLYGLMVHCADGTGPDW